jgi:hypothetical protein
MGLLETLLRTTIHVATLPVDMAKDVMTMGGALTDECEPATIKKMKKLNHDLADIEDDVDML